MIDEERTLEEYGYVSEDLSHGSNKPVIVICDFCGVEFARQKRESDGNRFCSIVCKGKYASMHRVGENSPSWHGGDVARECELCGDIYYVPASRVDSSKFCSRKCNGIWNSENLVGENGHTWNGGDILNTCIQCGEEYGISRYKAETSSFCSRECYAKWRSDNLRGDKNPNWNGGSSFGEYCEKFNEKFKHEIRDMYGGVCFVCGKDASKNGRKMDVHHVSYDRDCMCDGVVCEFVPLCQRCHGTTTRHRLFWERLFIYSIGYYEEYYNVEIPKPLLRLNI